MALIYWNLVETKAFGRLSIREYSASLFTISCNIVRGHPRPNITCTRNGHDLWNISTLASRKSCSSTVPGINRVWKENQKDNTVLIICKADYEEHSGWFMCNARNTLENHSAKTLVNITSDTLNRISACVWKTKHRSELSWLNLTSSNFV